MSAKLSAMAAKIKIRNKVEQMMYASPARGDGVKLAFFAGCGSIAAAVM